MATTTIPWGDGSGDNIYLTYPSASGDQTVEVSSDANTGSARQKVVTFSASGVTPVSLTVNQDAVAAPPVFHDYLVFDGQSQINTDINLPTDGAIKVYVKNGTTSVRAQGYFTVRNESNSNVVFIYSYATGTSVVYRGAYGTTSYSGTGGINWANHKNSQFWITPKAFGAGDSRKTFTKGSQVPTSGIIFAYSATNRFVGSMGIVYIYDNSAADVTAVSGFASLTPVYTLRPCTYNGEAGFWCVETSKFYGNSLSTGTLSVSDI